MTIDRPGTDEGVLEALALLGSWPDQEPPAGGLACVMAAIASQPPAEARTTEWLQPVLLSLAGVLAGGLAIYAGGAAVALPSDWLPSLLRPLQAASGFALAGLAFFGAGSLFTLALAPMLILELQRQQRPEAR